MCGAIIIDREDLRKVTLKERAALSAGEVREKSLLIVSRVFEIEEMLQGNTVMAYADFRNEVETGYIISNSMEMGKRVAVPVTDPSRRMIIPSLILDFPGDLQPGRWGIPEPKPGLLRPVPLEEIDVVLVPGVVFDLAGNRLGYGGGYYDRFLPRLNSRAVFVALAFELQVKNEIEPGKHDIPVHYIVTEERLIVSR